MGRQVHGQQQGDEDATALHDRPPFPATPWSRSTTIGALFFSIARRHGCCTVVAAAISWTIGIAAVLAYDGLCTFEYGIAIELFDLEIGRAHV